MGAEAARRDRLGPRRPRHLHLAGDALDGRDGRPPGAARRDRPPSRRRAGRAPSGAPAPAPSCSRSGSRSAPSASSRRPWSPRPGRPSAPLLERDSRSRWWALVLPLSIAVVIARDRARLGRPPAFSPTWPWSRCRRWRPLALGLDRPRRPAAAGAAGRCRSSPSPGPTDGHAQRPDARRWRSRPWPASASAGCSPASSPAAG